MKTPNTYIQSLKKKILMGMLMVAWIAILMALCHTWPFKHLPSQPSLPIRFNHQNLESYLLYLDKHQRFANPNQAMHKTIHVCEQSSHQQSSWIRSSGCSKQSIIRLI